MQRNRELDPSANFVAIVTAALLGTSVLMFAPEVFTRDWRDLLTMPIASQSGNTNPSTTFDKAMEFTGPKEGGCQNIERDRGNWHKGRKGFTCFGIVPYTAEVAAKDGVIQLPDGVDVWSLNRWFDADEEGFKDAATKIYKHYYWDSISADKLPEPVTIIAFDISVNGGSGLASRFLKATDHITDAKKRASEINRLMEAHYNSIAARDSSQSIFLQGWLSRAEKQRELISKY